jgi:hypothetical protein
MLNIFNHDKNNYQPSWYHYCHSGQHLFFCIVLQYMSDDIHRALTSGERLRPVGPEINSYSISIGNKDFVCHPHWHLLPLPISKKIIENGTKES